MTLEIPGSCCIRYRETMAKAFGTTAGNSCAKTSISIQPSGVNQSTHLNIRLRKRSRIAPGKSNKPINVQKKFDGSLFENEAIVSNDEASVHLYSGPAILTMDSKGQQNSLPSDSAGPAKKSNRIPLAATAAGLVSSCVFILIPSIYLIPFDWKNNNKIFSLSLSLTLS